MRDRGKTHGVVETVRGGAPQSGRKYRMGPVQLAGTMLLIVLVAVTLDRVTGELHLVPVPVVMVLPFILLVFAIALIPFISSRWWEHHYPKVSFGLAAVAVFCYAVILKNGMRMAYSLTEYFSFIALIGSLFVVSG